MPDCDCSDLVPGVHHTVPETTPTGDLLVSSAESCDLCQIFDSDLVAAAALRDFFGGGTVMFHDGDAEEVEEDGELPVLEWRGEDDMMIADGTSPWIENIPAPAGSHDPKVNCVWDCDDPDCDGEQCWNGWVPGDMPYSPHGFCQVCAHPMQSEGGTCPGTPSHGSEIMPRDAGWADDSWSDEDREEAAGLNLG